MSVFSNLILFKQNVHYTNCAIYQMSIIRTIHYMNHPLYEMSAIPNIHTHNN